MRLSVIAARYRYVPPTNNPVAFNGAAVAGSQVSLYNIQSDANSLKSAPISIPKAYKIGLRHE